MNHGRTFSGIQLGQTAILNGHTYKVIGRVAYKGSDDEDTWIWEEWRLTDGQFDYWLEYEPEYPRFTLYRETSEMGSTPGSVVDPNETGTLTSFEGEIPWPAKVGEHYSYTTYKTGPNQLYSVETDLEGKEFFLGTILPTTEVKKAFGLKELNVRGPDAALGSHMGWISGVFWSVAFLAVLVGPLIGYLDEFRTPVFKATLQPCVEPGPGCAAVGTRLGLIRLERANHPYVVEVASTARTGTRPQIQFLLRSATEEERAPTPSPSSSPTTPPAPMPVSYRGDVGQSLFRVTEPGLYVLEIKAISAQPRSNLTVTISKDAYLEYLFWLPSGLFAHTKRIFMPNTF